MGLFHRGKTPVPPHPRKEPRLEVPLTVEGMKQVFADCVDFAVREAELAGDAKKRVSMCYIGGMVKLERASEYILRPLAQDSTLRDAPPQEAWRRMADGALYNLMVERRTTADQAVQDLIGGNLLLFFPGAPAVLSFYMATEDKRSIGAPENEPAVKGARDAFVENLRTNTSLVRRHLRAPELRIREQIVGRQTLTPVDVLWLDGIADPATVARVERRLAAMDIDALLSAGELEEYLVDDNTTAFPLALHTERPDRFCAGLADGRVGILAEGLALGYLVPGTVGQFFRAPEDKALNYLMASALTVLRYLCVLITLLLPALYVAVVTFHQEMIPTRLALSIIAAKQDVPFLTAIEALVLLAAFEILQEAGLRLPPAVGHTVSIIGGLVVGTAAVEAKIVSPAVLIIVSAAGITGYTMPSQEFAAALRLWRFLLTLLSSVAGLFGLVMGGAGLIIHLARLESFGVPYLTPFAADGGEEGLYAVIRRPLDRIKLREKALNTKNRRRQR